MTTKKKKIVVIGGGTGTFQVLTGLKKYPVELSVIVSMTDSGGSNRVIRDEFGLLPTSDIRQAMVALSSDNSDEILRKLFTYRYEAGTGISGMTYGNLFMAALTDIYGSQEKAIEKTCEMLNVSGNIIPVTYDNVHLVARYESGEQVLGEHFIDEVIQTAKSRKIVELDVIPKAEPNPKALSAIRKADLIVLGPGDLFTSIIANLVIEGIAVAIRRSKARCLYVANLMTRYGQTEGYTAADHIHELEKYLGKGAIDICLVNKAKKFPRGILVRYKEEKAYPVKDDLGASVSIRVIRRNFVAKTVFNKPKSDKLTRSLIRHDPDKLAKAIVSLL